MPGLQSEAQSKWPIEDYQRPAFTKQDLKWAPLVLVDISKFWDSPEERIKLAAELEHSIRQVGFWIVTGHGISDEEVLKVLSIGNAFFNLPMEEKRKVPIDLPNHKNWGYREPTKPIGQDAKWIESVETYELHKDIPDLKHIEDHDLIATYKEVLAPFMKKVHERLLQPMYTLIALMLELPEDYFTSKQQWEVYSEDWLRFMLHPKRPREFYDYKEKHMHGGHTDQSALTALFPQQVACLQMLYNGEWLNVKPVPNGVTFNAGDLLTQITGGYVKATIHRVFSPPDDQLDADRLGLIYFSLFANSTKIVPANSPKLKRLGMVKDEDLTEEAYEAAPTSEEYTRARLMFREQAKHGEKREAQWQFKTITTKNIFD